MHGRLRVTATRWLGFSLLWTVLSCAHGSQGASTRAEVVELREWFQTAPVFGRSLYVLEAGRRDAPPLVLIHGLGEAGARDFEALLPTLSARYHVLAFDLPGLGRSSHADDVYSPARYAQMISELVAQRLAGPAFVVGHSMGAALALQLAADHPEQVAKLALLDAAGVLYYREYLREVLFASRAEEGLLRRTLRSTKRVLFEVGMFPASSLRLEDLALESNATLRSFFSSSKTAALLFLQHDFGPALQRLHVPVWLGWGRHDTAAPLRTATLLTALLHPSELHIFKNSAHIPIRSEPNAVLARLQVFFDQPAAQPVAETSLDAPPSPRIGTCVRQRDRIFEGNYDSISIYRCDHVKLRNVHARSLWVERSVVELENVTLESTGVAASIKRSRLRWTGGRIRAHACIDADRSELDLAGVMCRFKAESLRVRTPSSFIASVSMLSGPDSETEVHGEYELFRTTAGELPSPALDEKPRGGQNSRTLLANDQLTGAALDREDFTGANLSGADLGNSHLARANFRGVDLRDADLSDSILDRADMRAADLRGAALQESSLRGTDLRGADLRGADLRGARTEGAHFGGAHFDSSTRFPSGFAPARHALIAEPLSNIKNGTTR
ncbi:MAG: alpha/beta hydrolase fold protein [Myxococcaceae bacterium]|nr:alpha/beta hydrolase fold protein [Myxococcaceae bacterium]